MSLRERMNEKVLESLEVDKVKIERVLDLNTGMSENITVKQFDHNSRILHLTLEKNSIERLDLTNTKPYLIVRRPDTAKIKLVGVVTSPAEGKVTFSFTQDSLAIVGQADCEVVVAGADESILSFPIFNITIQDSIYDEMIDVVVQDKEDEFTSIEGLEILSK